MRVLMGVLPHAVGTAWCTASGETLRTGSLTNHGGGVDQFVAVGLFVRCHPLKAESGEPAGGRIQLKDMESAVLRAALLAHPGRVVLQDPAGRTLRVHPAHMSVVTKTASACTLRLW